MTTSLFQSKGVPHFYGIFYAMGMLHYNVKYVLIIVLEHRSSTNNGGNYECIVPCVPL